MAEDKVLYGGQAVIEGVMMRGRRFVSCAVRRENGDITVHSEPLPKGVYEGAWSRIPFLRAMTVLWDTLILGTRMLMFSANLQVADEIKKEAIEKAAEIGAADAARSQKQFDMSVTQPPSGDSERPLPPAAVYGTLGVSLALGVGLFFVLPLLIVRPIEGLVDPIVSNLIEGLVRFGLFLGYLLVISRMKEIQRIFQYHGAEHKTIAAYEAGSDLTPDLIVRYNKEHPRCGTGFLLTVVVVSIFVFAFAGPLPFFLRLASRVVLIPIVAAISYELIRFSAAHRNIFVFDWLVSRPSLWLQSLTTREPTPDMIQVAVAALEGARAQENAA